MASASTVLLPQHKMTHNSSLAMNFHPEILEKNSPWLYIHKGVYITMGHFGVKISYFRALITVDLILHMFANGS